MLVADRHSYCEIPSDSPEVAIVAGGWRLDSDGMLAIADTPGLGIAMELAEYSRADVSELRGARRDRIRRYSFMRATGFFGKANDNSVHRRFLQMCCDPRYQQISESATVPPIGFPNLVRAVEDITFSREIKILASRSGHGCDLITEAGEGGVAVYGIRRDP
jgi:hypothetical protein